MWFSEEIAELNYRSKFLHTCFVELLNEQTVSFQGVEITDFQLQILSDCLKNNNKVIDLNLSNTVTLNSSILYDCGSDHYLLNLSSTLSAFLKINDTLCVLNLSSNHITSEGAEILMNAVAFNSRLQNLDISCNQISDCGGKNIAKAITVNKTLKELNISNNEITDEGAKSFAEAIRVNKTLQVLNISKTRINNNGIMDIVKACTTNRTLYKLVCTHNDLSKSGLAAINEYIRKENALQIFDASWSNIDFKNGHWVIVATFQLFDVQQKLQIDNEFREENSKLTLKDSKYFLHGPNESYLYVRSVSLQNNEGYYFGTGAEVVSEWLKFNSTLHTLNLSRNKLIDKGAKSVAEAIEVNTTLEELDVSNNWISKEGVMRIVKACTRNRTLHKLVCTHNNLSKSESAVISDYVKKENAVQTFNISWNNIVASGGCWSLAIITLPSLRWSSHWLFDYYDDHEVCIINDGVWKHDVQYNFRGDSLKKLNFPPHSMPSNLLVDIIQQITEIDTLQKLIVTSNRISDDGAIAFSECLKTNTTLIEFDLSENIITHKGASAIAEALMVNETLQKLNISHNRISDEGAIAFSECLNTNTTLIELDLSRNNIDSTILQSITEAIIANIYKKHNS